ncbi:type II toxin-antitoxin system prevent-host-death family antitoxin [Pseudomonas sp. SWRI18]|uniref:type II toxin-antitoxin system Phd/YefM family antitoxin n=1 Tax=Pseudomonas sp. SWRI18 TaxID=2753888 RepID=UPI001648324E|nr:type II toxin-antitoxin system prevent-host-death family antitoxin [Pseudomonas sp. SWRI18]MBC3302883.1 type II toxin-antitoxin system prevent-host-death family antitoxin [Pseudomonas sp. SWRI18]
MNATCAQLKITFDLAKANFSKLVHQASAGKIITITQDGRALARLVAAELQPGRRIGAMKGKLIIPADFGSPLPDDTLDAFECRSICLT